mmetsp:Transcript_7207/g.17625  ORF Transcript_7207/g.17625 Transcript_7207/m.17625 type:complete len:365 (-) Transcript_7207:37-1131(-)
MCLVEDINTLKIFGSLDQTSGHGFFSGTEGGTRIVVLLVGLVISVRVSDLSLEVVVVFGFVSADSVPECPLGIGIDVHLDDSSFDGVLDVLDRGTRSTVEDELHFLLVSALELLGKVLLGVVEDDRLEVNVSRSVNSVDISERSGASEGGVLDLGKLFVGVPDFLGLGVKTVGVDVSVINTIFLSSGDTEFELEKDVELGEFLHVFLADANVLFEGFLGKIKHVRGEKRFSVLLVVILVGLEHTVEPREKLLGTVIGMENNRDSVVLGDGTDVHGQGNGTSGSTVGALDSLSEKEGSSSIGTLDDDGTLGLSGGFHAGVGSGRTGTVHSRNGVAVSTSMVQKLDKVVTGDNTRGYNIGERSHLD